MRGGLNSLCILLMLAGVLFESCEQKVKPPVTGNLDAAGTPAQESWNSTVVFSDSGRVRAKLKAGHIAMYDQRRETLLDDGIQIDFYTAAGEHSSRLNAQRGRVDDATQNMEAFGRVVVVSDSGTIVRTEYLLWDNATRKVRSDTFVSVQSPRETLQGYGFEADQGIRNYTIFRVSGSAVVPKQSGDTTSP